MGFPNPFKKKPHIKNPIDDIKEEVEKLHEGIIRSGNWWKGQISKAGKHVESGLKQTEKSIITDLRDTGRNIEKQLANKGKDIEQELQKVLRPFSALVTKEAMEKGFHLAYKGASFLQRRLDLLEQRKPDLVDAINEVPLSFSVMCFTPTFENFYSRSQLVVSKLAVFSKRPPKYSRKEILDVYRILGATSLEIEPEILAAVLKVASIKTALPQALVIELGDVIMEELGVPA